MTVPGVPPNVSLQTEHTFPVVSQESMAVGHNDWMRLRGNVEALGESLVGWSMNIASISVGAALAVLAIVLSLGQQGPGQHPSGGLVTGLWVAFVALVVFAACFGAVGLRDRSRYTGSVQNICADMDAVAKHGGRSDWTLPPRPRRSKWQRR